jgi:hypothetical protein
MAAVSPAFYDWQAVRDSCAARVASAIRASLAMIPLGTAGTQNVPASLGWRDLVPTAHRDELDLNFIAAGVFVPVQNAERCYGLLVGLGLVIGMNVVPRKLRSVLVENYRLVSVHKSFIHRSIG